MNIFHDVWNSVPLIRSGHRKLFIEISQNSQENTCVKSLLLKKDALAQVFSRELGKIFKNILFYRASPMAASDKCPKNLSRIVVSQTSTYYRSINYMKYVFSL